MGEVAGERDLLGHAESGGEAAQGSFLRPPTDDRELRLREPRGNVPEGPEKDVKPLLRHEPAGGDDSGKRCEIVPRLDHGGAGGNDGGAAEVRGAVGIEALRHGLADRRDAVEGASPRPVQSRLEHEERPGLRRQTS